MFGFDYVLASKVAIHLLNAGWNIYDTVTMANYETGGIPSGGGGTEQFVKDVSSATGRSPNEIRKGVQHSRYTPPSGELMARYQQTMSQKGNIFSAMPTWAWIAVAAGGVFLITKSDILEGG